MRSRMTEADSAEHSQCPKFNQRRNCMLPVNIKPSSSRLPLRARQKISPILGAGTLAPVLTLRVTPDQNLTLSVLRGKPVILAFYPADWSPVCGDQMSLYNEILPKFRKHDAELLGISVDGVWCHAAFVRHRHLHFPLLADFEPKGDVARKYRAYRAAEGVCERALIAWSYLSPIAVNPGGDGILDALEKLSAQASAHGHLENTDYVKRPHSRTCKRAD